MFWKERALLGLRFFEGLRESVRQSGAASAIESLGLRERSIKPMAARLFDEARRRRIRLFCMRTREESGILRLRRSLKQFLFRMSLSTYGAYLLLSSLFCMIGRLARGGVVTGDISLAICAILFIAAIPCLQDRRSLSHAIEESVFFRRFLHSIGGQGLDRVASLEKTGGAQRLTVFLCALGTGTLATFVPPLYLILVAALMLVRRGLFAAPELLILLLLVGLPFLNFFAHPSIVLCTLTSIASAVIFFKLLIGHCTIRFGALELLVGVLSIMLLFGGKGGILQALLMLSFIPMEHFFSKPFWCERALIGICGAGCICSSIGILQYFLRKAELKWVDISRFSDIGGRVTAVFSNPNVLSVYLLLTLPLGLVMWSAGRQKLWKRILAVCSVSSTAVCLILTWSRGAWLGAIAALVLWMLFYSASTMRIPFFSILPMGIYLPLLPHNVVNRFASIGDVCESSVRYRIYTWRGVLRMLSSHPFGIGVGEPAFAAVYPRYAVSGTESVPHAHNLFLQITAELGIGGILCFMGVLICFIVMVLAHMKCFFEREETGLILGGFCAVAGCLVMGLFDYVWYHKGLFWFFWAMVAMTVSNARLVTEEHRREEEIYASTTCGAVIQAE